ncbi:MAG TPA: nucleoside-diphosphate sugar epimerase/dehydratase [Candidatus Sumerlaeota bacterium]|nr:nucleoside-diphosphate sugar epimerase/dehydratase [Candidatus Sumerlaeota bacterium]
MNPSDPQPPPGASPAPPAVGQFAGLMARHPRLRRSILALADILLIAGAFGLAYSIGFDLQPDRFSEDYIRQFFYLVPCLVALRLFALWRFGLYHGFTRYTGLDEAVNIVLAVLTGTGGLIVFNFIHRYIPSLSNYPLASGGAHVLRVPWGVVVIDTLLAGAFLLGLRLSRRLVAERFPAGLAGAPRARRVLILGAGDTGEQVARDLRRNPAAGLRPVAFADPDPALRGRRIHGLVVAGGIEDLPELTRRHHIDMLIIALPRATPALMRSVVDHCREARLAFRTVPNMEEVVHGQVEVSRLRPVEIEDLLGRPPVVVRGAGPAESCLTGRRVLITGAGGSIGSELARQALAHGASELILLGRGENSLYDIHQELSAPARERGAALRLVVGDVRDAALIEPLLAEARPAVILHAAAHKHVHLMEAQPAEAIKNNVMGTRVLAEAARAAGVERFILISTDKAVRPTGVMGASKRLAEMIVSALNRPGATRFVAVRFGNVLGSRGSVIPLFRRQIQAGGPVTLTHPEMTRYFMTIPEAVSLVIEAGSQGQGGEVFLLDMGEPVKIVDLARNLITLSGLEPERDIPLVFTGARPGEKLFEELLTAEQGREPTAHPKIFRSSQPAHDWEQLRPRILELEALAVLRDDAAIRRMLKELIPDYQPGGGGSEAAGG